MSPQVDAEALRRIFEKFGSIASVTTPKGSAGETLVPTGGCDEPPKGVRGRLSPTGWFYSLGGAEDAAECLDGSLVGGKTVEVRVDGEHLAPTCCVALTRCVAPTCCVAPTRCVAPTYCVAPT
ncbi:hypothetical protein HAZT_HAZT008608 [Hyalella azteca]|uniref:RRM domain-containing protein n=1 Tax=Hyalella azteca TaxID=294128 RepID=A0A6A0H8V0_HYAAZ|nr:hypothetical protein HAZT_HAZT008608 [Hyalella azteca]